MEGIFSHGSDRRAAFAAETGEVDAELDDEPGRHQRAGERGDLHEGFLIHSNTM